jgi:hypothetical protein
MLGAGSHLHLIRISSLTPLDGHARAERPDPPEASLTEVWAKLRRDASHTRAFWMVTLACGHRSEVVADVDWQPSDGPRRADPKRVEEMAAEWGQHWAAHPEEADSPEAEHDRRMLAQGWPRPATETRCYACSRVRQIVAYEPIGWLATEPKAKLATPRTPSRAMLQRRLRELDAERARLRAQLESSEEDDA